jgi:hypothetical protein
MTALAPSFTLPASMPPDLAATDVATLTTFIAQLQAVPGGGDNLPPFLASLMGILSAAMANGSPSPGRPLSLGAIVLDAVAAWADGNDADFASQLRIESQFLAAVRAQVGL